MSPDAGGKPGEVDSHDYYAWESTRPYWDPGVPRRSPRIHPITHTGYPAILGIPGGPDLPVLPPTGSVQSP
jgi:hypothetical protein